MLIQSNVELKDIYLYGDIKDTYALFPHRPQR